MKARRSDKLAQKRRKKLRRAKKLQFLAEVEALTPPNMIASDPWNVFPVQKDLTIVFFPDNVSSRSGLPPDSE